MRYRRLSYRYAMAVRSGQTWPFGDMWQTDRLRLLVQGRWRPDADTYETATTFEIIVDLAGVEDGMPRSMATAWRRLQPAVKPPSTTSSAPVMNDESSLARKRATVAISRGSAIRPSGMPAANSRRSSSVR